MPGGMIVHVIFWMKNQIYLDERWLEHSSGRRDSDQITEVLVC